MKILYIVPSFVGHGTYFRCLHLAKALAKLGNQITLVCSSHKDFDLKISRKNLDSNIRIITLPRVKYHRYYTGQIVRGLLGCLEAFTLDYDLIHAFTVSQPPAAFPAVVSRKLMKKPMIVDWDDLWGSGFAGYHFFLVRKAIEWLETTVPKMALQITVVSDLLEQRVRQLGVRKECIHKIINGSNVEEIKPLDKDIARETLGLNQESQILVSMGNTYMGDSLQNLFQAFSRVTEEISNVYLLMVGRVDLENRPRKVKNCYRQIAGHVIFRIDQPFELVPYYLAAADALILPMDDIPLERARYPIRVGDYLASGRPIVSNAVGEVRKVFREGESALLSSPEDVASFSENMVRVLRSEELQKELGKRARNMAISCSWDKVAGKLNEIYVDSVN